MQQSPPSSAPPDACQWLSRVAAYHDGEMDRPSIALFEQHLSNCPQCSTELAELRRLSNSFATLAIRQMRETSIAGIHQAVDNEQPRANLLWIGGVLTGLAASALIIASAWLMESPAPKPAPTPVVLLIEHGSWEQVAVSDRGLQELPSGLWDQPMLADARTAEWMVQNLGAGGTP